MHSGRKAHWQWLTYNWSLSLLQGIQVKTTHLTPSTITINNYLLKCFHMYIIAFIWSKILTRQEICLTHLHIFYAVQPGNLYTLTYLDKLDCTFNYLIINNKYIYNIHPWLFISEKILLSPCYIHFRGKANNYPAFIFLHFSELDFPKVDLDCLLAISSQILCPTHKSWGSL